MSLLPFPAQSGKNSGERYAGSLRGLRSMALQCVWVLSLDFTSCCSHSGSTWLCSKLWMVRYVWPRMAMLAMFILRPCRWMHRTILHRYVMSFCLVFMLVLASNCNQDMKLNGSANICQLQHFLCTSKSGICGPHAGLSLFVSACAETHNSQGEKE